MTPDQRKHLLKLEPHQRMGAVNGILKETPIQPKDPRLSVTFLSPEQITQICEEDGRDKSTFIRIAALFNGKAEYTIKAIQDELNVARETAYKCMESLVDRGHAYRYHIPFGTVDHFSRTKPDPFMQLSARARVKASIPRTGNFKADDIYGKASVSITLTRRVLREFCEIGVVGRVKADFGKAHVFEWVGDETEAEAK